MLSDAPGGLHENLKCRSIFRIDSKDKGNGRQGERDLENMNVYMSNNFYFKRFLLMMVCYHHENLEKYHKNTLF